MMEIFDKIGEIILLFILGFGTFFILLFFYFYFTGGREIRAQLEKDKAEKEAKREAEIWEEIEEDIRIHEERMESDPDYRRDQLEFQRERDKEERDDDDVLSAITSIFTYKNLK